MSGDVRSLEEVIAAALESFDYIDVSDAHADAEEYEQITGRVAAAVREWCLAAPQIEIAEDALRVNSSVLYRYPPGSFVNSVRAVLHAVMGDEQ